MALLYLSLGSNLGPRKETMERAISEIEERIGQLVARSAFLETRPWGFSSQHDFLNACITVRTNCSPQKCLQITQQIERELGRLQKSDGQYHDRAIDIDLLFYDELICQGKNLLLPHPLLHKRQFVLEPLCQIAPDLEHPVLKKKVVELLADLTEDLKGQIPLEDNQQKDSQQQGPNNQADNQR